MSENKIALITGASRGIGAAILQTLGKNNLTVFGTATTDEGAKRITQTIVQQGFKGLGLKLNLTQTDDIQTVLDTIQEKAGAPTILVNNAGITADNLLLRMKDEEWEQVINTNLNGMFKITKALLKGMIKARWGRIVNIASVVAYSGNPGQTNYCAAKAGMIGFTKSLALEVASRNITVNAVAPGFIETDMTKDIDTKHKDMLLNQIPMARMGQDVEIAAAVNFLVSLEASYITGQTLHVNGGMYLI